MWKWLYKLSSPKWFYDLTGRIMGPLGWATAALLVAGLVWGLALAPPDYQMGHNYRIIYIHVPTVTGAMMLYVGMALLSIGVLVWRVKMCDVVAKAAAPVGAWLTAAGLATGSLWGIPTWGTWWFWDARLTSTLILFFLYVGIMALRSAFDSADSAARASAVLTLVGVVNIPIIHYSVVWWNTLHQPESPMGGPDQPNPPEIWIPIFIMGFAVIGIVLLAIILRSRNEILLRERRSQWVSELIAGRAD